MNKEEKCTELADEELQSIDGGRASYNGHRIVTALTTSCGDMVKGSNFYNLKLYVFHHTCGCCQYLITEDGWHLCSYHND